MNLVIGLAAIYTAARAFEGLCALFGFPLTTLIVVVSLQLLTLIARRVS